MIVRKDEKGSEGGEKRTYERKGQEEAREEMGG